jgi:hypothetical protein
MRRLSPIPALLASLVVTGDGIKTPPQMLRHAMPYSEQAAIGQ